MLLAKSRVFLFDYYVKDPARFQLPVGFVIPLRPADNYITLQRTMGELVVPLAGHLPGNKNPAHSHALFRRTQSYFFFLAGIRNLWPWQDSSKRDARSATLDCTI